MRNKELIALLQEQDPEAEVMIRTSDGEYEYDPVDVTYDEEIECVIIQEGDVEIQSPKQLEDHFPQITKMIPAEGYDNIIPESCLCQVDIENTLDSAGIKYIEDCGDYIIIK